MIRTDISKFEFANGRKPKGFGWWFFEISGNDQNGQFITGVKIDARGNFGEAKKAAIKSFRDQYSKHVFSVTVLP